MKKSWLCAITILVATCSATAPSIPQLRMTPTEITSGDKGDSQIGSSKLAGVHTKILAGSPSAAGFYSILLFVPPHTTIQAHSHRDDRMATVVSGTWHFGYGTHFDEKVLKNALQHRKSWRLCRSHVLKNLNAPTRSTSDSKRTGKTPCAFLPRNS